MGASSDIRKFNFYPKYIWSANDFSFFQQWEFDSIRGSMFAAFGSSVLQGLLGSPGGGLNVQVSAGLAVNSDGRLLNLLNTTSVALASPSGNPARSLVVLRPVDTPMTNIPEPLNPANNVPLHVKQEATLVVINGNPAANPVYPAIQAGDVIVAALKLSSGHATIVAADFDWAGVDIPRKRRKSVSIDLNSRTLDTDDEIVEGNCAASGLTFTLPPAASVPGQEFSFVKTDSTANSMSIASTDQISGQASQDIDDQWGTLKVYSNGFSYRVV